MVSGYWTILLLAAVLGGELWRMAADAVEPLKVAFGAVVGGVTVQIGSAEAAQAKIEELQQFAQRSTFNFAESAAGAQQLLAMGVAADDLIPTMNAVGNAVSAAGGNTETLLGSLRAIGQIRTKGRLQQEELLQLSERGIPAMQILREELGLTEAQMQQIGREGISADKAIAALLRGMEKRFGGAMEAQSKTLIGAFSNLGDAAGQLEASLGSPLLAPVTKLAQGATLLANGINALPKPMKDTAAHAAVLATGALAVLSVKNLLAVATTAKLAQENVRLQNEQLKAGSAAERETQEETQLAGALELTSVASRTAEGRTLALATAHLRAAAAAERQAQAEGRLSGGLSGGGGSIDLPQRRGTRAGGGVRTRAPRPAVQPVLDLVAVGQGRGAKAPAAVKAGGIGTPAVAGAAATAAKTAQAVNAGKLVTTVTKTAAIVAKASRFAKIGVPTALIADVAGQVALNALPDEGGAGAFKRIGQNALNGAGLGFAAGSVVPGLGNGVGAGVGAAIGVGTGLWGEFMTGKPTSQLTDRVDEGAVKKVKQSREAELLQEQNELLRRQNELLAGIRADGKGVVDTKDVSLSQQQALLTFGRVIG